MVAASPPSNLRHIPHRGQATRPWGSYLGPWVRRKGISTVLRGVRVCAASQRPCHLLLQISGAWDDGGHKLLNNNADDVVSNAEPAAPVRKSSPVPRLKLPMMPEEPHTLPLADMQKVCIVSRSDANCIRFGWAGWAGLARGHGVGLGRGYVRLLGPWRAVPRAHRQKGVNVHHTSAFSLTKEGHSDEI